MLSLSPLPQQDARAELNRQLQGFHMLPEPERCWSRNLFSKKGALLVAAVHQYCLWHRFEWNQEGGGEVDPALELKRLGAAWYFARRR